MEKITCPLREAADKFDSFYAIISPAAILTYKQLEHCVEHTRQLLKAEGIVPGERIALQAPNSPAYLIVLFALWRLGASAVLLSPRLPADVATESRKFVGCQRLFDHVKINALVDFYPRQIIQEPAIIDAQMEATVMFTSGSMDRPKAAVLTLANHLYNALGSNENIVVDSRDRWLLSLPLYHVAGTGVVFRCLLAGAGVVLPGAGEDLLTAVKRYQITHLSIVGTQLYRLLRNRQTHGVLTSLKSILVGGGPVQRSLISQALELSWPVQITYGLTEMASQVATSGKGVLQQRLSNAAGILKYRQVKIAGDGEIFVRGETLFKGYVSPGGIHCPLTADGWFATGDVGKLTADGELSVKGRKDNMFISGGENIQAEEIEHCLCQIEGIERAIVVPLQDEEFGFRPAAFIREEEGKSIPLDFVIRQLEAKLPRFKIPVMFYKWPGHIKDDSLKIKRGYFKNLVSRDRQVLTHLKP